MTRFRAEPYSFTYSSGYRDSARVAIRDSSAWRRAWAQIHANGSAQPVPAVDFSREMVVLVALGTRATGGFSIFVDSARAGAGRVEVLVRRVAPGPACGVTAALSEPVDLARIPAASEPVTFRERAEISDCR